MPNLKTDIKFVVHSDLNDDLVYAEFDSKKAAIRYARDYSNEFTYVDKVECFLDPETGRIDEIISSETVWTYLDESVDPENVKPEDEDYWDMMIANYEEEEANKYDLGDTTWFESMDNLVETLEESEDTVECKECFELFPKADCIKLDVGYICPTCAHCEVADEDTFKVDFPEYEKFRDTGDEFDDSKLAMSDEDVARVNEPFEEPFNSDTSREAESEPELTAEEAVPFLVDDEVEAVAGYEKAAEVVADSELENKEEILDTIDHIKEEEEEHIEELQDLVDDEIMEVENETTSEIEKEDEVEEIEDPEPTTLKEDTNSETRYWICFYDNNDVAVIEAANEKEAEELFVTDYSDEYFFDSWDHDWSVEEISKEEYDEWENSNSLFAHLNLPEHVNKECSAIESDQKLKGIDNAVVDCKVADVVTHSEDEKPVDCEGKKKPLEKPLTEKLDITNGYPHIKSIATMVHKAVDNYTKDNKVATRTDGTSFYVMGDKTNSDPEKMKKIILDTLANDGYDPEVVQYIEKGNLYGYVIDKIRMTARMTLSHKNEDLVEGFTFSLNNEKDLAEFTQLCKEVGIVTVGDLDRFTKATAEDSGNILDKLRAYRVELGDDFKIKEAFTEEEQEEYNMDEDGNSLESYDRYVRCTWCDEIYTEDQCVFEANMGWLCDRCYEAILSRGEKLIKNPTEEDEARILTEDAEDEIEPISNDPEEKPSKDVKMANTASVGGMDFEAACTMFGVDLEN